jgi:hypothetical protein
MLEITIALIRWAVRLEVVALTTLFIVFDSLSELYFPIFISLQS